MGSNICPCCDKSNSSTPQKEVVLIVSDYNTFKGQPNMHESGNKAVSSGKITIKQVPSESEDVSSEPIGAFTFSLIKGDLLKQDTQVIVNAANSSLHLGGGVAGAIRKAYGAEVQQKCDKIMQSRNSKQLSNGDVEITEVSNMTIFHAVGPVYKDGEKGEKADLRRTFSNILATAKNKGFKSLSLPPISSGIFGYPKEECAEVFFDVLKEFLSDNFKNKNRKKMALNDVRLCIIDTETFIPFELEYEKRLANLISEFQSLGIAFKINK